MTEESLKLKLLWLLVIVLGIVCSKSGNVVPFQTITGAYPGNVYIVSVMKNDLLKISIASVPIIPPTLSLRNPIGLTIGGISWASTFNPYVSTTTIPNTITSKTDIFLVVYFPSTKFFIIDYQIKIEIKGATCI